MPATLAMKVKLARAVEVQPDAWWYDRQCNKMEEA